MNAVSKLFNYDMKKINNPEYTKFKNKFIDSTIEGIEKIIINFKEDEKLQTNNIQSAFLINPFPTGQCNQYAENADAQTMNWIRKYKLIKDKEDGVTLKASKFINLTACAYATFDEEWLILISKFIVFLYRNDDHVENEETPDAVARLNSEKIKVLNQEVNLDEVNDPLTRAFSELMDCIKKVVDKTLKDSLSKKIKKHFDSTLWEAENRQKIPNKKHNIPSYEEYTKMRRLTGAVPPCLLFIIMGEKLNIPKTIRKTYLKSLERMCNDVICWSNDLKSYKKEAEKNYFYNNLVLVVQERDQCSLEEAVSRTIALHNAEVNNFEKSKKELYHLLKSDGCPPELKQHETDIRKYVEGMRNWMGSHYAFANQSVRYNEKDTARIAKEDQTSTR